jgi:hypothetical protein
MYYNNFNHRKESLAVANYAMKLGLRWETVACWWRVGGVLVACWWRVGGGRIVIGGVLRAQ